MRSLMFSPIWSGAKKDSPGVQALDAGLEPVRSLLRRLRIDRSGIALVETALVTPFLIVIVMGTADLARFGAAKMKIQQAVNRGLEMSWMGGTDVAVTDIQTQAAAQADVPTSAVTVTQTLECGGTVTSWSTTSCASGETARYTQIQISTTFTPSFAVGSLAKMLGDANGNVPISATGVLRIQ
ncbi:MAG TPA: TadE/TadG family type IV pilus assembly protein [Sphingobium sp.]|nr:TadE/TadG family type IV pilus assembly protein [Sphingobium sp.]